MAKATKRKKPVKKKAAKRSAGRKPAAKKKAAKRATPTPRRKKAAKTAAKKAVARKAPAQKRAAKKVAARKAPGRKTTPKKTTPKKAAVRKAPAKKAVARAVPSPEARAVTAAVPRAAAPMAAASPPPSPPESSMAGHVRRELTLRQVVASPDVVATIVAVGLGYRKGPASDPGFLPVTLDVDELVAIGLAERLREGVRPAELDREAHRTTVRATVNINLDQLGIDANATVRDTLTSLALGSWRPGLDEHARRNALAGFLVAWYRAGLT
jgi:hypothetical protein